MSRVEEDPQREERITWEVLADAYTPEEQAIGWYYYLRDNVSFPLEARCRARWELSPLEVGETVDVVWMSSVDACRCDMFVTIAWMGRELGVPLAQLEPIDPDGATERAIDDWHYWIGRGRQLC